jgi:hypothetical protein
MGLTNHVREGPGAPLASQNLIGHARWMNAYGWRLRMRECNPWRAAYHAPRR